MENIRGLLASISMGYPVGSVMMLKTGGEVRFKQRPLEGVRSNGQAERLILDGQQRLTSLFQALLLDRASCTAARRSPASRGIYRRSSPGPGAVPRSRSISSRLPGVLVR